MKGSVTNSGLVDEGFQMHLDRRHAEDQTFLDEQFP